MTVDRLDVGIDAGQSGIRAQVIGERTARTVGGLSHPSPPAEFVERVTALVGDRDTAEVGRVVVGMTTLPAAHVDRRSLASMLLARLDADEVWVTGDEIAAHAGAFAGQPGVVLVAGTGVACVAADPAAGVVRSFDGAGHLLGDEGGGFWLGRHAIRAALAAHDGRGPRTALGDLVARRFGGLDGLAARLHGEPDAVDRIAHAALDALDAASDGDTVAHGLVERAADRLASTVVAATAVLAPDAPIALDGRLLADNSPLTPRVLTHLRAELGDRRRIEPQPGSVLAGAAALAARPVERSPYRRWLTPSVAPLTVDHRRPGVETPAAARFIDTARSVVAAIGDLELEAIGRAADLVAATIAGGGLVHVFGTGHSHLLAEELFYRAGGLAAIDPILVPTLMLHEGALRSTELERTAGLADDVLADVEFSPADTLIVASNSGGNAVTNELAQRCRDAGVSVVAIVSRRHAVTSPSARLLELADVVIDNHGAVGDAAISIDGVEPRVGPTSTVAGATIVQALAAATVERLVEGGVEPGVLRSANTPGGDAHNERILAPLRHRIRSL